MIGDRIKELRRKQKITQEQLGKMVGLTQSAIYSYEKNRTTPDTETLKLIAEALNTTINYLIDAQSYENIYPLPKTKKVPLVGDIACGEPITADENIEGYIKVNEDIDADFCLRCKGDSMIGARIFDGDIVFIKQDVEVHNGEIAAILIDGEATLKRIYFLNGELQLRAENPMFHTLIYTGQELETVRIIGKATYFLSRIR